VQDFPSSQSSGIQQHCFGGESAPHTELSIPQVKISSKPLRLFLAPRLNPPVHWHPELEEELTPPLLLLDEPV